MAGYAKDFLISAYLSRFIQQSPDLFATLEANATRFYDQAGRDAFRTAASLDAEAIKVAKATGFCT